MTGFQEEKDNPQPKQLSHRYDGVAKVTGKAQYAAEFPAKDVTYAYLVQSTIPSGSIAAIDQTAATRAPGVLAVITPFNAPKLPQPKPQPPAPPPHHRASGKRHLVQRPAHRRGRRRFHRAGPLRGRPSQGLLQQDSRKARLR